MKEIRNTIFMILLLIFVLCGLQGVFDFLKGMAEFLTNLLN